MKKNEEGLWVPNPDFLGKNMLPYVWNSIYENLDLGNRLANAGFPVILCNVNNFYFDLAYTHHPAERGLYWGGFVNTRSAFDFAPYDVFKSTLEDKWGNPTVEIEPIPKGRKKNRLIGLFRIWRADIRESD